jgi:hypothetical protein
VRPNSSLVLVLVLGCSHRAELDRSAFDEISVLDCPPGVSDLSIDDHGTLWAIPERDHFVLEIPRPGTRVIPHPLDGVAAGLDTEAITWLGPGKFAIGTEGQDEPSASVLFADLHDDGHVVITGGRELSGNELGVTLVANKGVEGTCGRGDSMLAAIESVGRLPDGTRFAPIVHLRDNQEISVSRLRLTSDTGKISALACDAPGGDVWAIERHYGIARLLHFRDGPGDLTPTIVRDLDALTHGTLNLEGLVRLPDGRFAMVNDNQMRTVEGPTELLLLR